MSRLGSNHSVNSARRVELKVGTGLLMPFTDGRNEVTVRDSLQPDGNSSPLKLGIGVRVSDGIGVSVSVSDGVGVGTGEAGAG